MYGSGILAQQETHESDRDRRRQVNIPRTLTEKLAAAHHAQAGEIRRLRLELEQAQQQACQHSQAISQHLRDRVRDSCWRELEASKGVVRTAHEISEYHQAVSLMRYDCKALEAQLQALELRERELEEVGVLQSLSLAEERRQELPRRQRLSLAEEAGIAEEHVHAQPTELHVDPTSLAKLYVTIVGATGLRAADGVFSGKSDAYCACQITGRPESSFKTEAIMKTLNPTWNHSQVLDKVALTDSLHFQVYDWDKSSKADSLGHITLQPSQFFPDGFDGEVDLLDDGKGKKAMLKIKIDVLSLAPDLEAVQKGGSAAEKLGTPSHFSESSSDVSSTPAPEASSSGKKWWPWRSAKKAKAVGQLNKPRPQDPPKSVPSSKQKKAMKAQEAKPVPASLSKVSLSITIVNAEGLRPADGVLMKGKSDPYCTCQIADKPKTAFKTKTVKKTLDPSWNHEQFLPDGFAGKLDLSNAGKKQRATLAVQIKVLTPLTDIAAEAGTEERPLSPHSGKNADEGDVHSAKSSGAGHAETYHKEKESELEAKSMASLSITIINAVGLRGADGMLAEGTSDPYCTCQIRGKPETSFRTKTVKKTRNPTWNHEQVLHNVALTDSLYFHLYDWDRGTKSDSLGHVTVEPSQFFPHGFAGEVKLADAGKKQLATLAVKIQVLSLADKSSGDRDAGSSSKVNHKRAPEDASKTQSRAVKFKQKILRLMAAKVHDGTVLTCNDDETTHVYSSMDCKEIIGTVSVGEQVEASDSTQQVRDYYMMVTHTMVPIKPRGAVKLEFFEVAYEPSHEHSTGRDQARHMVMDSEVHPLLRVAGTMDSNDADDSHALWPGENNLRQRQAPAPLSKRRSAAGRPAWDLAVDLPATGDDLREAGLRLALDKGAGIFVGSQEQLYKLLSIKLRDVQDAYAATLGTVRARAEEETRLRRLLQVKLREVEEQLELEKSKVPQQPEEDDPWASSHGETDPDLGSSDIPPFIEPDEMDAAQSGPDGGDAVRTPGLAEDDLESVTSAAGLARKRSGRVAAPRTPVAVQAEVGNAQLAVDSDSDGSKRL